MVIVLEGTICTACHKGTMHVDTTKENIETVIYKCDFCGKEKPQERRKISTGSIDFK